MLEGIVGLLAEVFLSGVVELVLEVLARLDTFSFAWLFAFAFTGVRYLLAK